LIKVHASSITAADCMMRKGEPWLGRLFLGLSKPKYAITGTGFSGEIEAVGDKIQHWQVEQHICGESIFSAGSNAEYLCISEDALFIKKPAEITHSQASTLCDGVLTSYSFLSDLHSIRAGHSVLIIGASGSLGSAAVQIANHLGAEVTAVCSGDNRQLVQQLGADLVINYQRQDFTKQNKQYDFIYDSIGKHSFSSCKGCLKKQGIYLSPVINFKLLIDMLCTAKFSAKKATFSATGLRNPKLLKELLLEVSQLITAGKIDVLIDREYQLSQASEAHRYIETGRKKGNIAVSMINKTAKGA
ncbi:MAG: NAD(P)-dependent alcohol dehydrogenase, partial [Psychromonas sp.]|nr:NAD(P)-dependent alcohol dehydrogenase [Psychromonas sp.]